MKIIPYRIDLRKRKIFGTIIAIDGLSFDLIQRQHENWIAPPGLEATRTQQVVQHGDVSGKKYLYRQAVPASWKRVDYVWNVPGGFVSAMLDAHGADFDKTPFEASLNTLRMSALE